MGISLLEAMVKHITVTLERMVAGIVVTFWSHLLSTQAPCEQALSQIIDHQSLLVNKGDCGRIYVNWFTNLRRHAAEDIDFISTNISQAEHSPPTSKTPFRSIYLTPSYDSFPCPAGISSG